MGIYIVDVFDNEVLLLAKAIPTPPWDATIHAVAPVPRTRAIHPGRYFQNGEGSFMSTMYIAERL
jgi:hypothetical protein